LIFLYLNLEFSPSKETQSKKKCVDDYLKRTKLEDFEEQKMEIEFSIAMMSISIIRFITDYMKYLPVSIGHHLLVDNDILCVLVPLIEDKPYLRTNANGFHFLT